GGLRPLDGREPRLPPRVAGAVPVGARDPGRRPTPGDPRRVLARGVPDVTPVESPACACVIVASHRPDSLAGLLAGLAGPAMELVVVNVGDDPAVRRVVDTTGATHVPLPGNPGYAAAVNLGAAHTRAEIVLFMNDDLAV